LIGKSLGHYRILRALGAGGMGQVYAAEDTRLRRRVALKLLPAEVAADPTRRARFQREAEAVAALDHPNIVTIHTIESVAPDDPASGPVHFLTMQLVQGQTLAELISPEGLPSAAVLRLAVPLADALSAAHEAGIVHRDLKPANIMVGGDGRVRLLDFGIAKFRHVEERVPFEETRTARHDEPLTQEGTTLGTVAYMSPEQVKGHAADPRSDIFSLGAVIYEMATGCRPFLGDSSAELASAILRDTPTPVCDRRPGLSSGLGRVIERCLQKNPDNRYQRADELHRELKNCAGVGDATETAPRSNPPASRLPLPERPSLAVLPFVNLSSDPEQDYFADGLWTDINADLVKISGLFLISQTTTAQYRGRSVNPRQVGIELGVNHVLEGSVRKAGNRVRITVQLVNAQTGESVWAERYDRKLEDLFALQDEINEEIVTALDVRLLHGESHRVVRRSLRSPEARDAYYRAMAALFASGRDEIDEARRLLAMVAEIEPSSPLSYVFSAFSYYFEANTRGFVDPASPTLDKALAMAQKAIDLQDPTGSGHMVKGMVCLRRGQHEEALEASLMAIDDRPSCPWAFALRGAIFNYIGKPTEAIALARTAIRHTPFVPPVFPAVLATGRYLRGHYEQAAEDARSVLDLAPDTLEAHLILAAVLAAAGRTAEVAPTLKAIRRLHADFTLDEFAATQPYKDAEVLAALMDDLRKAGLS